jgi:hypothetical protein
MSDSKLEHFAQICEDNFDSIFGCKLNYSVNDTGTVLLVNITGKPNTEIITGGLLSQILKNKIIYLAKYVGIDRDFITMDNLIITKYENKTLSYDKIWVGEDTRNKIINFVKSYNKPIELYNNSTFLYLYYKILNFDINANQEDLYFDFFIEPTFFEIGNHRLSVSEINKIDKKFPNFELCDILEIEEEGLYNALASAVHDDALTIDLEEHFMNNIVKPANANLSVDLEDVDYFFESRVFFYERFSLDFTHGEQHINLKKFESFLDTMYEN